MRSSGEQPACCGSSRWKDTSVRSRFTNQEGLELTDANRLDLTDVRDDGNDPLRPLIARACEWIEQARSEGGCVLVHCVGLPI